MSKGMTALSFSICDQYSLQRSIWDGSQAAAETKDIYLQKNKKK